MAIASLPPEAQQLISNYRLGTPTSVYKPNTVGNIIVLLFVAAFCVGWTLLAASITSSPLIPSNLYLFHSTPPPSSDTVFQVFQIVFPLFGLLGILACLWGILRAIGNRNARGVVCSNGVACISRKQVDAARWEDILTVIHGVDIRTTTTHQQQGGTSTSTSVSHKYTVHCRDGRKILFDSTSCGRKIQDLGETLQVELARWNQVRGHRL